MTSEAKPKQVLWYKRKSSAINGPDNEMIKAEPGEFDGMPIVAAFMEDEEVKQMDLAMPSIGLVMMFQKWDEGVGDD